jgi:hypothetical protein
MTSRPIITHTAAALVAASALVLATGTAATADPNPNPHSARPVTLHCQQLGDLIAVQEGNGIWTRTAMPWHVLDSNLVLTVYAVHFVLTPPVGDPTVVDASKPPPENGRLDVCTEREQDPTLGVFDATYSVSYTHA